MEYPKVGDVIIPDWNWGRDKVQIPKPLPGTKRYLCFNQQGELVFESDIKDEAFNYLMQNCLPVFVDRQMKTRVNHYVKPKEKNNGEG